MKKSEFKIFYVEIFCKESENQINGQLCAEIYGNKSSEKSV